MSLITKTVTIGEPMPAPTAERPYWRCDHCGDEAPQDTAGWIVRYVQPEPGSVTRDEKHFSSVACEAAFVAKEAG